MLGDYGIDNLIGQSLKGYRVDRFLARGGMGLVFAGVQESLDRPVAIKFLYPHLSEDGQFRERFEREARAAARLVHPNIVRVLDFGLERGLYFMVQDLVDGESLRERLTKVYADGLSIRPEAAIGIVQQVASALAYAHQLGYVHRDVKPGNVLLARDGRALLTDFGVVKILGESQLTSTGLIIGTPEYMAPEQGSGEGTIGPAADQYALAVVAYELIVGRVPFKAPTPVALMRMHLMDAPPPPRTVVPWFPAEIDAVLMRALAKKPEERFEGVDAFAGALLAATGTGPITGAGADMAVAGAAAATPIPGAGPATPTPVSTSLPSPAETSSHASGAPPALPPAEPPVAAAADPPPWNLGLHRPPTLAIGGGILALAIILGLGGFLLRGHLFPAAGSGSDHDRALITGSPSASASVPATTTVTATAAATPLSALGPGATPVPSSSVPAGMFPAIVFSSTRNGVHDSQIYIMNLDGSGQRQLAVSAGHSWGPRVSPDGTTLMFSSVIGHHTDHDPSGGALQGEDKANHDVFLGDLTGSSVATMQTTNVKDLTTTSLGWDNGWSWSPDGTRIAFSSNRDGNYELYSMNADGSDVRRLTDNPANDGWPFWTPDGKQIVFSSDRSGNEEIYIMDADGTNVRQLTNRPDTFDTFPAVSPDGTQIVFSSQISGIDQGSIYVMNIDGSDVQRLTNAAALDNVPSYCPSGKQIVFMSNRDGNPNDNIYIMNSDGTDVKRLTTTDTKQSSISGDQTPNCTYLRIKP